MLPKKFWAVTHTRSEELSVQLLTCSVYKQAANFKWMSFLMHHSPKCGSSLVACTPFSPNIFFTSATSIRSMWRNCYHRRVTISASFAFFEICWFWEMVPSSKHPHIFKNLLLLVVYVFKALSTSRDMCLLERRNDYLELKRMIMWCSMWDPSLPLRMTG